jgi:succinyl-diaminopimelate desuccinylase
MSALPPIDAQTKALIDETLLSLCAIASPIGEEKALCDLVAARIAKSSKGGPVRRYGDSIVVPWIRKKQGRKHVALVGHLDTVRTENGPARIDGDRLFGAGSSDMKSGLAVMIALAETVDDLACDVTLVFYAREEGPFVENELGPVLDQDDDLATVDLAVCMEPSDNKLHLGCSGSLHATLMFEGRTAHSARPWEGENAITKAAGFLAECGARAPEPVTIDGLVYRSVFTITQARDGGRGRNVVPDTFTLNLNHRFPPTVSIDEAERNLLALVAGRASVTFTDKSPAAPPQRTHPLVEALAGSGVRDVAPKQAWTDVARFHAHGIPAVNFGPGENAQAHQKNESTSLALVHEGYAITKRWLEGIR